MWLTTVAAQGATFVVETTADAPDAVAGDGVCASAAGECTLRAAVEEAQAAATADTIQLPAGVYTPTLERLSYDCLGCEPLLIQGAGSASTMLDGSALSVVFLNLQGDTRIEDITLSDARVQQFLPSGASLHLDRTRLTNATFEVSRLTIEDSTADTLLRVRPNQGQSRLERMTLLDLDLRSNVTLIDSTVAGDIDHSGQGETLVLERVHVLGGIDASATQTGTLEVLDSVIEGSTADAIRAGAEDGFTLTVVDSEIHDAAGCGVYLEERGSRVTISDADISGNGCGIFSPANLIPSWMTIERSRVFDNAGDGVVVGNQLQLAVIDSSISGNDGFGLRVQRRAAATLQRVAIVDNDFGGIELQPNPDNPSERPSLVATNSTISGNRSAASGAGIFSNFGSIALHNVTVADNDSDFDQDGEGDGGGIAVVGDELTTATLESTIVAGNRDSGGEAPECSGPLQSHGYNLIESTNGCEFASTTGDLLGVAAQLMPLSLGGSLTPLHALQPSSPGTRSYDSRENCYSLRA